MFWGVRVTIAQMCHDFYVVMIDKVKIFFRRAWLFWSSLFKAADKKEYIKQNAGSFKTQIIVFLVIILLAFVSWHAIKPAVKGMCRIILQDDGEAQFDLEGRVVGIEAQKVKIGTTMREVKSIGILKANAEVVIKAEISGKIQEVLFKEGAKVEKDQELIRFEDDLYKAGKEKFEAAYTLNKSEHERMKKLYDQKVGALKDYDKAVAQMNEAKAQLDEAEYQLSKTVIKAPFDGIIGIMKVTPGNIVQQHTDLVNLVDNSSVKVEFMVPAKHIENVAVGQSVEITVDSFGNRVFTGGVDAVDPVVDTKNHSILVRAVIPNPTGVLKHGLFANVTLVTGEKDGVVLVDEDAVFREGSIEFVWIVDKKGRTYRKRILTGARDVNGVEILAGLQEADIVVTAGHLKLTDGMKVKILNKMEDEKSNSKKQKAAGETDDEAEKIESEVPSEAEA